MQFDYPTIRYGRRTTAGNADYYDVLSKSPDFSDDAEMIFRKHVCQSIQWTCGENTSETYPDSFLFWKLSDARILVTRLSDAGCDSRGRPHAISIEALLVKTDGVDMPVAEFLVKLMCTPDWSAGTLAENPGEAQHRERMESFIKGNAESLLLASHPHFQASGISCICAPERPVRPRPPSIVFRPTRPQSETDRIEERESSQTLFILSVFSVFLLLCAVVFGGLLYYSRIELESTKRDWEEVKRQLKEKNTTLVEQQKQAAHTLAEAERQKKQMEDKLAEANTQRTTIEVNLTRETARAERAEGEVRRLRIQLSNAPKDEQIQMLMQRNQQNEEALQRIPDRVKNIIDQTIEKVPDLVRNRLHEEIQTLLYDSSGEE